MASSSGLLDEPRSSRGARAPANGTRALATNPPSTFGKYILRRELGRGGMGIVYEGEDTLLERAVAIKVLPMDAADDVRLAQLMREARCAARLNHPNTVAVYDAGEHAGGVYIAMELVRGASALEYLQRHGPFAWQEATRIVAEVCHGMAAAHAAGLIHRDIKPANIMLVEAAGPAFRCHDAKTLTRGASGAETLAWKPWAKLADFGLSRSLAATGAITMEGQVAGTPHYMSPEQIRGERLDERADIYSLGATFFSLLTGRFPFERDNVIQILFAHCTQPTPDVREVRPDVPERVAQIILRAMAKEPRARFASAEEMLAELQAILLDDALPLGLFATSFPHAMSAPTLPSLNAPTQRAIVSASRRRTTTRQFAWPLFAISLAIAGTIGLAGILSQREQAPDSRLSLRESSAAAAEPPPSPSPDKTPAAINSPAHPPVGMRIVRPWSDKSHGAIKLDGSYELMRLAPDGRTLAFGVSEGTRHTGRLTLLDLPRGEVVGMHVDEEQYASFSSVAFHSERYLLLAANNSVRLIDRQTNECKSLIELRDGTAHDIALSPDRQRLLVGVDGWSVPGRVEIHDLYITPETSHVDHRRQVQTSAPLKGVRAVAWSACGHYIAASDETGRVILADANTQTVASSLQVPEPPTGPTEFGYALGFAPDGEWIAAGGYTGLVLWNTSTHERRVLPEVHGRGIMSLAFSPDGKLAATASPTGIRIWDLASGEELKGPLDGHESNVVAALAFTPDGRHLISGGFDRQICVWNLRKLGLPR